MNKTVWIALVVAVLAIGGIVAATKDRSTNSSATTEQSTTVSYQGEDGKNALELLKANATVETTTDPSLGEYVTAINGVKSGTDGKYWIYRINGAPGSVGAGEYQTSASDTIEWKME